MTHMPANIYIASKSRAPQCPRLQFETTSKHLSNTLQTDLKLPESFPTTISASNPPQQSPSMNVGSILNGESPPDDAANTSKVSDVDRDDTDSRRSSRPSLPELPHRQSINNLLNDAPGAGEKKVAARQDSYTSQASYGSEPSTRNGSFSVDVEGESDEDDMDADAADIDRELAEASLQESQEKEVKLREEKASKAGSLSPKATPVASKEPAKDNGTAKTEKFNGSKYAQNASRKNLVKSEFEKINQLKNQKKKPTRYTEPPIWAHEWTPPSQISSSGNGSAKSSSMPFTAPGPNPTSLSQKPVFSHEAMVSTDLECSITGVIPPQSTVRTIAEWLYANFVEISVENRQHVELELKFGSIVNKETGSRIDIGVSTECIFTNTSNTRFEMGVHEAGWNEMKNFLEELEKSYTDIARKDPSKPRRKFSLTESNNTDFFYQITERNEKPQRIRVSKDNQLNPPRYVAISKRRVSDLYVHNPSSMYDLRLSLSIEFPVPDESIESIMKKNKATLQRGKKRASYSHAPTVTRFDFTEVSSPRTMKNKTGRNVVEHDKSYELELEIDTFQIFRGFDRIRDGSDTIRFEELVEIFLNNARCLNNRVTKFASA